MTGEKDDHDHDDDDDYDDAGATTRKDNATCNSNNKLIKAISNSNGDRVIIIISISSRQPVISLQADDYLCFLAGRVFTFSKHQIT